MIMEILSDTTSLWLLITAILFTFVGRYFAKQEVVTDAIETTIDSLIEQGFIKTEGHGAKMEIVKWKDWCNEND